MSPDLPAPGTKIRVYVQVTDCTNQGSIPLATANGLTQDIFDPSGNPVFGVYKPYYLGPMLLAQG
jgi:hypothetical protein